MPKLTSSTLFYSCWASFLVLHIFKQRVQLHELAWYDAAAQIALLISAVLVMHRPDNKIRIWVMLGLQLVVFAIWTPYSSNSWVAATLITLVLLGGYEKNRPAVRYVLIGVYFFAVLAKLNHGYLDPEASCGAVFMSRIAAGVPSLATLGILLSLALELSLPALLLFGRTRRFAVIVGYVFHLWLTIASGIYVFDFSALAFCVYAACLPDSLVESLKDVVRLPLVPLAVRFRVYILGAIAAATVVFWFVDVPDAREGVIKNFAWVLFALVFTSGAFLRVLENGSAPWKSARTFERVPASAWLVIALLILVGASPYLGLRTVPDFTMFSNLRTEAGYENHLFMPRWLRVAKYQDDWIEVVDTDIEALQPFAGEPVAINAWTARVAIHGSNDGALRYVLDGETHTVESARQDPLFARPPSWLSKKLLLFRPLMTDENPCGF